MSETPQSEEAVKLPENSTEKKPTGFQLHPELINRNGRPPGKTFSGYLREALEQIDPRTGKERYVSVAEALMKTALKGDVAAIREFADRLDGRPKQAIEHSGEIKGNTIVFTDFSNDAEDQ